MSLYISLRKIDDDELIRLIEHYNKATFESSKAVYEAIMSNVRKEPLPTPIWRLREAYDSNLSHLTELITEYERRSI